MRVIFDILIVIFIIFGWWFLALPIVLYCLWRYYFFAEIVLAGMFYDALFGFSESIFWNHIGLVMAGICCLIIFVAKKLLR